ncbi:type II secretion system protein [Paenibacillus dakarensis]|uniref:type II secretion system protein n=1 Tax=Paenibacillus dakarensis TaxID=1527293 RepID=UPI0009E9FD96|nr:type II secretion system protein [Paenibacillus dakarensis]
MLTKALKARKERLQDEKGFTLIELLAVIVILGIIAVIAIPMIGNILDKSKADGDVATARQIYDAARLYVIGENDGDFTKDPEITLGNLQTGKYMDGTVVLPSTKATLDGTNTVVKFNGDGELTGVTLAPSGSDDPIDYEATEVLGVKPTKPSGGESGN